jgi:NAD(P)-dependent dehydrogenase (short-subunit alcohol dehydrogenase family)
MTTQFAHPKRIIVVTGASRGAGKGIALALAQPGSVIYVTGRSQKAGDSALPGTIYETAELINLRGAIGIPVVVDHASDEEVKALFEKVQAEQGRLDILVNNACAIPDGLVEKKPFWEKRLNQLDIMQVGMRSHYVASYYAAPLLLRQSATQHPGLVVHTSSAGGRCYMHGPAYGGGKAAVDKFANDMAVDLRSYNVACVSIWMGLLRTERTLKLIETEPEKYGGIAVMSESPEFTGRVINALYEDSQLMSKSGQILVAAEEAVKYGVLDIDGRQPPSPTGFLGHPAQANPAIVE